MKHACALIAAIVLVCASYAQTFRSGIEGTVTDASGAAVPQAQVTARNVDTELTRTTQTDDQGNYFIPELPLVQYEVTAAKAGFRTTTVTGIRVEVSARVTVNITLQPGAVKEAIEVRGEVPLVETAIDNLGGTLEARQVEQLPVNGRDFSKILTMVPGSVADPGAVSESPGSFGLFSMNGNRGRSNNYLLDGTDMNDGYRNDPAVNEGGVFGVPATILPLDAVAEFGILSGVEAEYGRNSGAIVNIVTKSGTNNLHGTLFEYFRNNWLDARNYFNTTDQPQDLFLNNQFGGSVGGPIVKDKTFFFASYEGQRERVGIPDTLTVPTQALINAQGVTINPVIAKLLAMNPWGVPLPASGSGTVQATDNAFNTLNSVIGKIDQHVGEKDVLSGRYFFGNSDQNFPLGLQEGAIGPGYNTIVPTHVQVVSLSYTHVISNNLLTEFRGGWNRFFETFTPEDASFNPASIGLVSVNSSDPLFGGLPQISFPGTGISSLGNGGSQPRGRIDTNWQYFTNLSYTKGKHNFKTGIEFRRTTINGFQDTHFRGELGFNSLADFLTGTIDSGAESEGDAHRVTHQNNYGLYFQDNFRMTRRLTLNYGLRWDYFGVIHEIHNRFSIFDPTLNTGEGGLVQVGSPGLPSLYPKDFHNFSPRTGLAYDVTGKGKTVVRAGFGLYYDAFSQDFFLGQAPYNCTFCPGPAYNAIGPSTVLLSFSPTATIQSGVPIFAPGSFGLDNEVFTVDQRLRTPYVYEYNLNVQQQLSGPMALQVGYVGSAGRRLFRYVDINQGTTLANGDFQVPYSNFSYINQFQSSATSNYNSLQAVLTMKSWHGLTSSVNYTWSHSIDNASDGLDFVPQASQPDNSFNPKGEKGPSNFDVRNRLSWNYHYEVPTLGSWTPKLTKGWSLDGVLTVASGAPYDPTYYFDCSNTCNFNGAGEGFGRLDLVGNPFAGTSMPGNILNLQAFAVPCTWVPNNPALPPGTPAPGQCLNGTQHFGDVGRNAFTGPHYRDFDFSIAKTTPLSERVTMQLRADIFNIFNHPNFSNPELPCYCVDALNAAPPDVNGHPTGNLAVTATPDVGSGNPFLGGGGPRDIQLGLRFSF